MQRQTKVFEREKGKGVIEDVMLVSTILALENVRPPTDPK